MAPRLAHHREDLGKLKDGRHVVAFDNLPIGTRSQPNEIFVRIQEIGGNGIAVVRLDNVAMVSIDDNRLCRVIFTIEGAPPGGLATEMIILNSGAYTKSSSLEGMIG